MHNMIRSILESDNMEQVSQEEKEKYFETRTKEHIAMVQKAAQIIVSEGSDNNGLEWREFDENELIENCKIHDASKFVEPERTPYISITWRHKLEKEKDQFDPMKEKGYKTPGDLPSKDENAATLHHVLNNKHHPECWCKDKANIDPNDRDKSLECIDVTDMPALYIAEQCFTGDTKISLLDGTETAIKDLIGKDHFWVYSCTQDGMIVPGRAHSAKITNRVSKLCIILLDNGEQIKCTPDHLFMLHDGSYKEAGSLLPQDSLMPLYRDYVSDPHWTGYEKVYHPGIDAWDLTHRLVVENCLGGYASHVARLGTNKIVCHHKNLSDRGRNKRNNDPTNLEIISKVQHYKLHSDNRTVAQNAVFTDLWKNPEFRSAQVKKSRLIGAATGSANMTAYNRSAAHRSYAKKHMQDINLVHPICSICGIEFFNAGVLSCHIKRVHEKDPVYVDKMHVATKKLWSSAEYSASMALSAKVRCSTPVVCDICGTTVGNKPALANHKKAVHRESMVVNHKIVSVLLQDADEYVYDITVDTYHNFALSSGVFVHNCCDCQAMSWELKKNTVRQWFDKQRDVRWHYSDEQWNLINKLIKVLENYEDKSKNGAGDEAYVGDRVLPASYEDNFLLRVI